MPFELDCRLHELGNEIGPARVKIYHPIERINVCKVFLL